MELFFLSIYFCVFMINESKGEDSELYISTTHSESWCFLLLSQLWPVQLVVCVTWR